MTECEPIHLVFQARNRMLGQLDWSTEEIFSISNVHLTMGMTINCRTDLGKSMG